MSTPKNKSSVRSLPLPSVLLESLRQHKTRQDVETVYELLASNQLPRVKLGASVRIPYAALQEWVAKNTESGA